MAPSEQPSTVQPFQTLTHSFASKLPRTGNAGYGAFGIASNGTQSPSAISRDVHQPQYFATGSVSQKQDVELQPTPSSTDVELQDSALSTNPAQMDTTTNGTIASSSSPSAPTAAALEKRKRGRPKGSKSKRSRGTAGAATNTGPHASDAQAQSTSVESPSLETTESQQVDAQSQSQLQAQEINSYDQYSQQHVLPTSTLEAGSSHPKLATETPVPVSTSSKVQLDPPQKRAQPDDELTEVYEFYWKAMSLVSDFYQSASDLLNSTPPRTLARAFGSSSTPKPIEMLERAKDHCDMLMADPSTLTEAYLPYIPEGVFPPTLLTHKRQGGPLPWLYDDLLASANRFHPPSLPQNVPPNTYNTINMGAESYHLSHGEHQLYHQYSQPQYHPSYQQNVYSPMQMNSSSHQPTSGHYTQTATPVLQTDQHAHPAQQEHPPVSQAEFQHLQYSNPPSQNVTPKPKTGQLQQGQESMVWNPPPRTGSTTTIDAGGKSLTNSSPASTRYDPQHQSQQPIHQNSHHTSPLQQFVHPEHEQQQPSHQLQHHHTRALTVGTGGIPPSADTSGYLPPPPSFNRSQNAPPHSEAPHQQNPHTPNGHPSYHNSPYAYTSPIQAHSTSPSAAARGSASTGSPETGEWKDEDVNALHSAIAGSSTRPGRVNGLGMQGVNDAIDWDRVVSSLGARWSIYQITHKAASLGYTVPHQLSIGPTAPSTVSAPQLPPPQMMSRKRRRIDEANVVPAADTMSSEDTRPPSSALLSPATISSTLKSQPIIVTGYPTASPHALHSVHQQQYGSPSMGPPITPTSNAQNSTVHQAPPQQQQRPVPPPTYNPPPRFPSVSNGTPTYRTASHQPQSGTTPVSPMFPAQPQVGIYPSPTTLASRIPPGNAVNAHANGYSQQSYGRKISPTAGTTRDASSPSHDASAAASPKPGPPTRRAAAAAANAANTTSHGPTNAQYSHPFVNYIAPTTTSPPSNGTLIAEGWRKPPTYAAQKRQHSLVTNRPSSGSMKGNGNSKRTSSTNAGYST